MPAFAMNGQRRHGPALAIALSCVAALGAAASVAFAQIGADWLRISLVAQVIIVAALATVLARQIVTLRRTQASLLAANTDLAGAQASLETNNRILRATQAELKRARQQLVDGIEGLSDGFALYDREDRLVVSNSRYQKLFGLHPDLLQPGTPFLDILRAHVSAGRVTAAIGREDEWVAERLAQHRDPRGLFERNIDGHWFRFSDRPTSEGGTVTIFTQIDELKQREQRLRENQAILQSILDHIPVTVGITDRERRIVLLNRRLEDLYGVHQADAVGRNLDEVRPRRYDNNSAALDHFRVVETGEPILGREDDYADGRDAESWITNVVPIKGEDGAVRYVLRTTFEVPQLAQANRKLADHRAFLLEAERQAKIASWHQTPEGNYHTIWSENIEAVIGYAASQICDDAAYLAVIHPADRERIARLFAELDRQRQSYDVEYRVLRADGRTIWVRGITKAEFDEAGEVVRFIGSIQDITESKRAEEALRDNEALLKEAQRRARLAYWLWDPAAGRYSLAPEAAVILGLPVDHLTTNDHFLPYVHEDDRAWVAEAFLGQTERLEPCVLEYRWRRPDGKVIWLRDMCEQERDSAGQVRRLVGTIQDVTEQKRSEEALRENQALLLAAQRRARIAYWLEDRGPNSTYIASDFMAEILDVPAHALPKTDGEHLKLVHPEDRARVAHAYERAVAGNMPYGIEYRVFRGDGSIGWLRELAEFQVGPVGKPGRMIGTIQDITEQKSIEVALRDSEARLRSFMDHAPVAMFEKDLSGRFTMLNRHDAAFFGLPPEDVIGRRSADLLASDDAALVEAHDRSVLAAGAPVERELQFANRPRIEWTYEVKFPIRDAKGVAVAIGGVAVDISALKRAEQALRASEERLREVVLVSHIGIFDHDHGADTIYWSPEQRKNYGFGPDEAVTLPKFLECVFSGDRERIFAAVKRAHDPAGDGRFDVEHRIVRRDGALRWLDTRSQTFFGGDGATRRPVRTIGAVVDITARKNAELALTNSEARLRRAQMQAKLACWSWNLETDTYVWAPGSGLALGLADSDLPISNATYNDLVHPDDRDGLWRLYVEVEAGRDSFTAEFRIQRADGEVVWVEEIGEVERDATGRRVSVNGTLQDVSERKRAEAALRDSEVRLRGFLDHAPFAMYLKDTDLRYLLVNRAVEQFQGMTSAEICGRTPDQIYPPALAERFIAEDREVLARGTPLMFDYSDPTMRSYADSLTVRFPVRDSSGRIVAIGGITQDVSERKEAERALKESETRLKDAQRRAKLAYWSWDPVSRAYVFGEEYTDIIGVESGQDILTDDQYLCFVHEADRDWVTASLQRQRDDLEPGVLEYRVRRPDGRIVWLRDSCERELDAAGQVLRLVGTVQDVTDQKTTELALRESEARLADAQRRAKLAYWTWSGERRSLTWHSDAAAVLGVQADAMPATSDAYVQQLVHAADRTRIAALYKRTSVQPSPYEVEYRIVKLDGTTAWVREIGEPTAGGGSPPNYVGTLQDVTEQKQAELALRDSEARLRGFLDHAPFSIYLRDSEHRYLIVNREIERFTGKTAAEICGKTPEDIYPPEQAREYVENDRAVMRLGEPVTVESTYPTATTYAESVTVRFPVRDSSGRIVAIGGITQDVTEQKQAERALRASDARMRSFMDNAPVAVAIKDLDRRFVLLNNKIELAFGRPAHEIIGRRTIDLSESEGARAVDALEREVIATGKVVTAEAYFPDRASLPWTFEVKFPIRDSLGEMVAIGGVAIDITDRKKAELALAESEARFRSFMDNAPFDMVVKDLTGRYLMVNRGVEDAWRLDQTAVLGRRLTELSDSGGVAQVEAIEREVVETGRMVAREVQFTDLGPEWTYEVKFPIRDAGGNVVALGGVALDISDRKKAQMALAESEARLRRAQQQARLAYWSWQFATDRAPEEYRWSPGSGELLGMTDAAMPRNDGESMNVTLEDDRERLRRLYNEVRAGLDSYAIEYRVRRPDGRVVWVREIAEAVRDAEGRRVGVEGTMQDITEQRALEEQLRQAQKMESIGQLTGGIAHDFNNLMAVILGNLELLAEDLPGNTAALQKIHTAIRSTLRGSDLTQRLLAFARQQSLAPKLTQIDALIRSMRDLLLRPLGPTIETRFDLAGGLRPTEIDQARLETSLLNLVINARDAMPDGGKLTIAAANVTIGPDDTRQTEGLTPGDYVLISVTDSGTGMTGEVRARAFDPFFTTKGVGKGTGLGLSMVYGFVKQSGGHVELASEVGHGTTVKIYLPVAKGAAAAGAAA